MNVKSANYDILKKYNNLGPVFNHKKQHVIVTFSFVWWTVLNNLGFDVAVIQGDIRNVDYFDTNVKL